VVAANELLMDALKHGHVEAQERLQVHLVRVEGRLSLSVWNSGHPVAADFEPRGQPVMGLRLVLDLAEQYGGCFTPLPEEGGTRATLAAPEEAICL
jgi:two-component sensor histidine kinase